MRQKQLVAVQNRINTTNETLQVGEIAWLTVPRQVIDSTTTTLKRLKSKRSAEEGKMLVKIARIHTEPAVEGRSALPTQQFVLYTHSGRIENSYSIDMLQRCYPPPEANLYATVDVLLPTEEELQRKKGTTLRKHYRRYVTLLTDRMQVAAATARTTQHIAAAAQVAIDLNAFLTAGTQTSTSVKVAVTGTQSQSSTSDTAVAVTPTAILLDRPPSPPPPAPSSPPPAPDAADVFPCTHCQETLTAANCSHCLYPLCRAPFHTPATGCRLLRMLVVDTVQL